MAAAARRARGPLACGQRLPASAPRPHRVPGAAHPDRPLAQPGGLTPTPLAGTHRRPRARPSPSTRQPTPTTLESMVGAAPPPSLQVSGRSTHVTRRPPHGNPLDVNEYRGSSEKYWVELRGLEPLTPTLPVWCATSCATAPNPARQDRSVIVHTSQGLSRIAGTVGWWHSEAAAGRGPGGRKRGSRHAETPGMPVIPGLRSYWRLVHTNDQGRCS